MTYRLGLKSALATALLLFAAALVAAGCAATATPSLEEGGILDNPIGVAEYNGYLFVTNANFDLSGAGDGFLAIIDEEKAVRNPGASAVVQRKVLHPYVADLAIDQNTGIAYIADRNLDQIALVDVSNPLAPRDVVVNPAYPDVHGIAVGQEPYSVTLSDDGQTLYSANMVSGDISVVDLAQRINARNIQLSSGAIHIALQPNAPYAYVTNRRFNSVSVVDLERNAFVVSFVAGFKNPGLGNDTRGVAFSTDGSRAYIAVRAPAALMVVDTTKLPQNPDQAVVKYIQLLKEPTGVALSPAGDEIWVTNYGSAQVSVISTQYEEQTDAVPVGLGPTSLAFIGPLDGDAPDQYYVFVTDFLAHSLAVVDGKAKALIGSVR